jgi:hypothetical protein
LAHLSNEIFNDPEHEGLWRRNKNDKKAPPKILVFKDYPRDIKKTTYIDEYKEEHTPSDSTHGDFTSRRRRR